MSQNRSTAVMARRIEPHDSLDDFPTPPWATRALVEHVLIGGGWRREDFSSMSSCEPCCNRGFMARPMGEYFPSVAASDIFPYGYGEVADYLSIGRRPKVDWTFFNPPFKAAEEFFERALDSSKVGIAMFARNSFIEGVNRYRDLFSRHKPTYFAPFAERVVLKKGRLEDPDKLYPVIDEETGEVKRDPDTGQPIMKRPSTATAYAWFVWSKDTYHAFRPWETKIIPPCRKQLTRPGDYEVAA